MYNHNGTCTRSHLFLLLLVLLLHTLDFTWASTSSTLLKHAVKSSTRSTAASRAHMQVARASRRVTTRIAIKNSATGRLPFLGKRIGSATAASATYTSARTSVSAKAAARARQALATRTATTAARAARATATISKPWPQRVSKFAFRPASISNGVTARPFPTRSSSSGFRSFSQRATRLQTELQKSFSLRAIFSDVLTNHPGKQTPAAAPIAKSSSSTSEELLASTVQLSRVRVRPSLFQNLQRIAAGTISETWSGFTGGYALCMTTSVAKRITKRILSGPSVSTTATSAAGHVLPYPNLLRTSQQSLKMHSQSLQFGVEWAQMSAVFGACRLLIQTLRGTQDEWNTVAGSALAGAVFAASNATSKHHLKLPPVAMARGALLYGGTMFLLHPHLWKQGMQMAQLSLEQHDATATTSSLPTTPATTTTALPWWDGME